MHRINCLALRFSTLFFLLIFAGYTVNAQVVLNEIQASNGTTIADEDGDYEDWIELYNTGDSSVNLAGYGLSDDYDRPYRWRLPSVTIAPGEFLLVWASGKDRSNTGSPLHTNFSISSAGEEVILTDPNGMRVDEHEPRSIPRDYSYGRVPDGSDNWFYFTDPTPDAPNDTEAYGEIVSQPEISHNEGLYAEPIFLSLSAPDGAEIYYTIDGSEPVQGTSRRYTEPVYISTTRVIRVRAFKENAIPSETLSKVYSVLGSGLSGFNSNLPVFVLHQFSKEIMPNDRSPAWLTVMESDESGRTSLAGESSFQTFVMANKRGSSSLTFPKNMFSFHMIEEDGSNRNDPLLGLPPEHNWILYAPYTDMTLMRNVISYRLAEDMGWYAPRTKFVELFLQDGDGRLTEDHYHGVYVLVERIKWDNNRVDITKISPEDNAEPDISGGYIIKKDRLNEGESGFTTGRGTTLAYARPNEADVTPAQNNWIRTYMSDFEDALFGPNFTDPSQGYEAYINTDSFIDHFLVTELLKEIDGYRLSTFMYKDRGEKLVMGPLWDFNLSLGIADYMDGWQPEGWYYPLPRQRNDCYVGCGVIDWYERLFEDPAFMERLENRWWELRQNLFSKENLSRMINENREILNEPQERNFERWPTLGSYVWPNWYVGDTWEDEVDWMEEWLMQRVDWIDNQMGEPPVVPEVSTLHFWYFSNDMPNNTPLETLSATFSHAESGEIRYESSLSGYPFEEGHPDWRSASMERRNQPTPLNYREEANQNQPYDEGEMRGLQVRQPFLADAGENTMIFRLPVLGQEYEQYQFAFAAMDEGAADALIIDYSTTSGTPQWETTALDENRFDLFGSYNLYEITFSNGEEISGNPDFRIRIRFDGEDMPADAGDRVTFNNISFDGINAVYVDDGPDSEIPQTATLEQNYPNPFNSSTIISYGLPETGHTVISVYNVLGQRVAQLVNEQRPAGFHEISFDASGLSSGLYFYRLQTSTQTVSRKMLLAK